MAAEIDCFLKERALGLIPYRRPILLLERSRAGNKALLDVFKSYMTVFDRRWHRRLLSELTKFDALRLPLGRPVVALEESAHYAQVLSLWGDREPIVALPDQMEIAGRARLTELGVPEGAWFACIHVREGGYSPGDEHVHAHRNGNIATMVKAIRAITNRGGWVIRMGDASMSPLNDMSNVIDYALSPLKTDWMDLWLCANTRFFVGTTSGLTMVATVFSRPCALVNMIPHGASLGMAPGDISIPKVLVRADGNVLSLLEIRARNLSGARYAQLFEKAGVTVRDNSAEEIHDLVVELMARLDGTFEVTSEDIDLQRLYRAHLYPGDYCHNSTARIGRDWLRANRDLVLTN